MTTTASSDSLAEQLRYLRLYGCLARIDGETLIVCRHLRAAAAAGRHGRIAAVVGVDAVFTLAGQGYGSVGSIDFPRLSLVETFDADA